MSKVQLAEQSYTQAEVGRLLHISQNRLRELLAMGQMDSADFLVPGGGHKARRWKASTIAGTMLKWSPRWPYS